jgi:hypothetical protein
MPWFRWSGPHVAGSHLSEHAFVDAAFAVQSVAEATRIAVEIARKPIDQIGFAVHPRRWSSSDASLGPDDTTAFLFAASAMLPIRGIDRCA